VEGASPVWSWPGRAAVVRGRERASVPSYGRLRQRADERAPASSRIHSRRRWLAASGRAHRWRPTAGGGLLRSKGPARPPTM